MSAFVKTPIAGPVRIGALGLDGDAQADRKHHGGPDMAVHLYPQDHRPFWRDRIGDHPLLNEPGAFGTNIACEGLIETHVEIGDRFRLGTALLEVSQPRKPCWKIEHRFGRKGMVATIVESGRCGWYFRVIEEGIVEAGAHLEHVGAGNTGWTVAAVIDALVNPAANPHHSELASLAACEPLTPLWRDRARLLLGR